MKDHPLHTGLIILAAGASERMGAPKQLLPHRGESLIRRSCRIALEAAYAPVLVVLGANAEIIKEEISSIPLFIFFNAEWKEGMGSSIRNGMKEILSKDPKLEAVLILLCDQPTIEAVFLKRFRQLFVGLGKPIVATAYEDNAGVPALFGRHFFENLLTLRGTEGAKKIIAENKESTALIHPETILPDIDTPEDYQNLINKHPGGF